MFQAGDKVGNYVIEEDGQGQACRLGEGAGGATYKVRHSLLGTTWALKVLHKPSSTNSRSGQRFLAEAKAASALIHPHIARVIDFGEENSHLYYVMELCEGGSTESYRKNDMLLIGMESLATWFWQAAQAIAHSHLHNILHRDIKPSNLLIARQGSDAALKVIDFGLAGQIDGTSENVIGTPLFVAPEQLAGSACAASDVFSLAASFLWLVTGKNLDAGDVKSVIRQRSSAQSYAHLLTGLPDPWRHVMARALDIDPARRPADGEQLSQLIKEKLLGQAITSSVPWQARSEDETTAPAANPAVSVWQDPESPIWQETWPQRTEEMLDHGVRSFFCGNKQVQLFEFTQPEHSGAFFHLVSAIASCQELLGLEEFHAYKTDGWMAVEWNAPADTSSALDALRRHGHIPASTLLGNIMPIARAFDHLSAEAVEMAGFHPSQFHIDTDGRWSFLPDLAIILAGNTSSDSRQTMSAIQGISLTAAFCATLYQLLSGRPCGQAAFTSIKAFAATPHLSERSNRLLSRAISGQADTAGCARIISQLAIEERVDDPHLRLEGEGGLTQLVGLSRSMTQSYPGASQSQISFPVHSTARAAVQTHAAPAAPPSSVSRPPAPPLTSPPATPSTPPQTVQPPTSPAATTKTPRKPWTMVAVAAVALLAVSGVAWRFLPDSPKNATVNHTTPTVAPVNNTPPVTAPEPAKPSTTSAPSLGPEVRVPADVATITEAIEKVSEAGSIIVTAGEYKENLSLSKNVRLISQGAILLQQESGITPLAIKGGAKVTIEGFTIRNDAGSSQGSPPLVLVTNQSSIEMKHCVIEGSGSSGIVLMAQSALSMDSGCRVLRNRKSGVEVTSGSKALLSGVNLLENYLGLTVSGVNSTVTLTERCLITRSSTNGLEILQGGHAKVEESSEISHSVEQNGIVVNGDGSRLDLIESRVLQNKRDGIMAQNLASVNLTAARINNNQSSGINAKECREIHVHASFLEKNIIGIIVDSSQALAIKESSVHQHIEYGIAVLNAKFDVENNDFSGNTVDVMSADRATGRIAGNKLSQAKESSLIIEADSGPVDQSGQ